MNDVRLCVETLERAEDVGCKELYAGQIEAPITTSKIVKTRVRVFQHEVEVFRVLKGCVAAHNVSMVTAPQRLFLVLYMLPWDPNTFKTRVMAKLKQVFACER